MPGHPVTTEIPNEKFFGWQAGGQRAGVRFLKHNIRDDFDDLTDVAAFYRVKSVPSFLFLVGGAQVTAPPFAHR